MSKKFKAVYKDTVALASVWERQTKEGKEFLSSNRMTFGELRNLLKEFKEECGVSDQTPVNFMHFNVNSENEKAPKYHLKLAVVKEKKDKDDKKTDDIPF